MQRLTNPIRPYAWGSTTSIAELLGIVADGTPQAEMWLGAHPDAPSTIGPHDRRLDELVASDPTSVLGGAVESRFGSRLPYLLKLLAADMPLSLQVHPSAEQARAGYEAENADGVPQDALHRRYRDPFHKPEMIVALTPFEALCGLRPPEMSRRIISGIGVDSPLWQQAVSTLGEPDGLRRVFELLLSGQDAVPMLVDQVAAACGERLRGGSPLESEDRTVVELNDAYPGDPGVFLSLLLNRVSLQPGEALYLPAGNLHAYLRGTGVEIMASSDNVLRAGLTPKHVDVQELMRVVDFTPVPVPYVEPEGAGPVLAYRPGAEEFELLCLRPDSESVALEGLGPRIVLLVDGRLTVKTSDGAMDVERGASLLVPDADGPMSLQGEGVAFVARVPGA